MPRRSAIARRSFAMIRRARTPLSDVPKAPPADVAARLLDGLADDEEDIFPDANAQAMSTLWHSDPKAVERALATAA